MYKIAVLIIGKNEGESINNMIDSLQNLSADRFWVLDRCTDDSISRLKYESHVIINKEGEGFLAGKMRDLGLNEILKYDYETIIMLDGDRVPSGLTNEEIQNSMEVLDMALIATKEDHRSRWDDLDTPYSISKSPIHSTISCGLIVKRFFLDKIRNISYMKNRCFHPDLDGTWGCEDYVFGALVLVCCGIIGYSTAKVHGKFDHTKEKDPSYGEQWMKAKNLINMITGGLHGFNSFADQAM